MIRQTPAACEAAAGVGVVGVGVGVENHAPYTPRIMQYGH
jgi:hypothetical protein